MEKCKEVSPGSFKPNKQHDVLSTAFGKEEHRDSARGVGVNVTVREGFGKPKKSKGRLSGLVSEDVVREISDKVELVSEEIVKKISAKISQEIISEMQPMFDSLKDKLHYLMKRFPQKFPTDLRASADTHQSVYKPIDSPVACSSCQSVNSYPFSVKVTLNVSNLKNIFI